MRCDTLALLRPLDVCVCRVFVQISNWLAEKIKYFHCHAGRRVGGKSFRIYVQFTMTTHLIFYCRSYKR